MLWSTSLYKPGCAQSTFSFYMCQIDDADFFFQQSRVAKVVRSGYCSAVISTNLFLEKYYYL